MGQQAICLAWWCLERQMSTSYNLPAFQNLPAHRHLHFKQGHPHSSAFLCYMWDMWVWNTQTALHLKFLRSHLNREIWDVLMKKVIGCKTLWANCWHAHWVWQRETESCPLAQSGCHAHRLILALRAYGVLLSWSLLIKSISLGDSHSRGCIALSC